MAMVCVPLQEGSISGTYNGDDDSEDDNENICEIKARTMYRMVEEINIGGDVYKLLLLTNSQARLLSSLEGSIQRVLDSLEIPAPKLVMNFLCSQGVPAALAGYGDLPTGPYASKEEMLMNDERLVQFLKPYPLFAASMCYELIFDIAIR